MRESGLSSQLHDGEQETRDREVDPTEEVLSDFDDLGCYSVFAEFGEVVSSECELEEESFVCCCFEFPA